MLLLFPVTRVKWNASKISEDKARICTGFNENASSSSHEHHYRDCTVHVFMDINICMLTQRFSSSLQYLSAKSILKPKQELLILSDP